MEPLGFSLGEMRQLLTLLADLGAGNGERAALTDRLRILHQAALARIAALREELAVAEGFAATLTGRMDDPPR
jgi:MerR family transcriptional regulator, copper efflux regulator